MQDCICRATEDIDENARFEAPAIDSFVNRCVGAATDCLRSSSSAGMPGVTREHLAQILLLMRHGHRAIRELLRSDGKDPMVVSAMPLARVQVETLFAVSLIVERPESLGLYLKDGWKKMYVRHLLMLEEWGSLPRMREGLKSVETRLEAMRLAAGVTEIERDTVDLEELGFALPNGVEPQHIRSFPTPAAVIAQIQSADRKSMLQRLYFEYQFLCGFVHFSPAPSILSTLLDQRQLYQGQFTEAQREEVFQKEIAGPALWLDQISILQSCSEIYSIYPHDIELARALSDAWMNMSRSSLIGQAMWEVRTKRLLNALG